MASNNTAASQANDALGKLKYEIATELNAQLGPDVTSRENGSVGGEMTKRLVRFAEQSLKNGQRI